MFVDYLFLLLQKALNAIFSKPVTLWSSVVTRICSKGNLLLVNLPSVIPAMSPSPARWSAIALIFSRKISWS